MSADVHVGDCVKVMALMPAGSVDAVVTDPPAGISFMGKDWDHDRGGIDGWTLWFADVMAEALRVCKPGAHAFVWALPRTSHWTGLALERAGWQIRDVVTHLFGSGFPKSHNLPNGWGTALKPSAEFWFLARKPLAGTVAANVLAHGTGALNVDGCRIGTSKDTPASASGGERPLYGDGWVGQPDDASGMNGNIGRWPANVILDPEAAAVLDQMAPDTGGGGFNGKGGGFGRGAVYGDGGPDNARATGRVDANAGASRFYYVAKASGAERNAGLDGFEAVEAPDFDGRPSGDFAKRMNRARPPVVKQNVHPTVKPVDLMRWLVRLVCPPGGLVLDPFAGSGTTGIACVLEGFRFVGIEQSSEYAAIARARIGWWAEHPDGMQLVDRLEHEREQKAVRDAGQLDLFGST